MTAPIHTGERLKAQEMLELSIEKWTKHEMDEPYCNFENTTYDGDTGPILLAIVNAFKQGVDSALDTLTPEEVNTVLARVKNKQDEHTTI